MAKLILTNVDGRKCDLLTPWHKQGFVASVNENVQSFTVAACSKKRRINKIVFRINNAFIVAVGSIIYKDNSSEQALKMILEDFLCTNDLGAIRRSIIGNYVILIRSVNKFIIFNDSSNLTPLYYYCKFDSIYVCSDLFDLAQTIVKTNALSVNEANLLQRVFVNGVLGTSTIFNEIKKLLGHEYIDIDIDTESFNIMELPVRAIGLSSHSLDFNVRTYFNALKSHVSSVVKQYRRVGIFMTGGLDSRVVLSAFLNAGIKPILLHGVGNSAITNTNTEDLIIVKSLAEKYNLELLVMDWSSPNPIDKHWEEMSETYGFHSDIYSGTLNIIHEIERLINIDFIEFGYMGEVLRNGSWMDEVGVDLFSCSDLARIYLDKYNSDIFRDRKTILKGVEDYFESVCVLNGINPRAIHRDQNQIFDNEYRKLADTHLLNFINLYTNSISLMGNSNLLAIAASIPYNQKTNGLFQLEIIKMFQESLLSIPILSHGKILRVGEGSLKKNDTGIWKMTVLKKILMRNPMVVKIILRTKYLLFPYFDNERGELAFRTNGIKKYVVKKYNLHKYNSIKHVSYAGAAYIARYAHFIFLINQVEKEKLSDE